jgi:hypothetical protein
MEVAWEDRGKIAFETYFTTWPLKWDHQNFFVRKSWNAVFDSCKNSTVLTDVDGKKIIVGGNENGEG